MRKFGIVVAILLLAGVALMVSRSASGGAGWLTSYDDAVTQAEATGKPILADFTGSDWCGWCKKLDKEVFSTSAFKEWAGKNVILLVLDLPRTKSQSAELKQQNQRLQQKYGVRGFPTILFLDEKGGVIGRSGYRRGGAEAWIAHAQSIIDHRPVDVIKPRLTTSLDAAGRDAKKSQRPELTYDGEWTEDYEQAKALAASLKLPMLLDFSGSDWCPPCIKMEKDVFSKKAFHKYAAENLVLVLVDFPRRKPQSAQVKQRNRALAQKYGLRAYPTMIVVDAEGKELGRMVGYVAGGTTGFISKVEGFLTAAK